MAGQFFAERPMKLHAFSDNRERADGGGDAGGR